jgi:DNA-binding NarL/FixJ family response regulator
MTRPAIRVAIADDQELMRSALGMVVRSQPDLALVGEAPDGAAIVQLCLAQRVDVVLMDVRMPRLDGIEATRQILSRPDAPKVIVVTTFDLDEYAFSAIRAGASGFLLKDARAEEIVDAIRVVHAGHAVVSPPTTRRLIEHLVAGPTTDDGQARRVLEELTTREREVFLEVATGASNAEIAKRLFLSEATVKTHVGHVLGKLRLRDRVQAVVLAYETGLVRPGA